MEAASRAAPPGDCAWPTALGARGYKNASSNGLGTQSCVFLARNKDGVEVIVVISKKKRDAVEFYRVLKECRDMKLLRLKACRKGEDMLSLHEAFLPSCLDSGVIDGAPYLAMQDAPRDPIGLIGWEYNLRTRAEQHAVFAQLIASIYALHGVGMSHNNLLGNNIVLDSSQSPPPLALIDFREVVPLSESVVTGSRRDGNAIWRWTAQIADCGKDAQWADKPGEMSGAKAGLFRCLHKWSRDGELAHAMEWLINADIRQTKDQQVDHVYETSFVQKRLPELQRRYRSGDFEGCTTWDQSRYRDLEGELNLFSNYKCDTIPSWDKSRNVCYKTPGASACFSLKWGVLWACGAGVDPKDPCVSVTLQGGGGTYDGACLMPEHPAYKRAWDFADAPIGRLPLRVAIGIGELLVLIKVGALIAGLTLSFCLFRKSRPARATRVTQPELEMSIR